MAATGEAPTLLPEPAASIVPGPADVAESPPPADPPDVDAEPDAAVAVAAPVAAVPDPRVSSEGAGGEAAPSAEVAPRLAHGTDGVKVIALDPGHGGPESGAVNATANGGRELIEKNVNLAVALKLRDLIQAAGYEVVLTRDTDRAVHPANNGSGYRGGLVQDLQTRVDIANAAAADLFLSIHHNGSENRTVAGAEVWYNQVRPFADQNRTFAQLILDHLLGGVRAAGYPLADRGIKDDDNFRIFQGRAYNIFVLGPGDGPRPHPATEMPGALVEGAFVSHDADARMLANPDMQQVIAQAYADAIGAYFARFPD